MRYVQTAIVIAVTLMANTSFATKPNPAVEAKALIGAEYTSQVERLPIAPGRSSCTAVGEGGLYIKEKTIEGWGTGQALCDGREVVTLLKHIGAVDGHPKWKIVDVLLLPPLAKEGSRNTSRMPVTHTEIGRLCDVTDLRGTSYIALLRWNNRERIDWRNGVEKAWTYDIQQERIVPASTRGISCEWSEP